MLLLHVSLWHCHIGIGSGLERNCLQDLKRYVLLFLHWHKHCAEEIIFFIEDVPLCYRIERQ